jgi:hypothetical protein
VSTPIPLKVKGTAHWPWHLIGALAAASLLLMYLPLIFHHLSVPRISALWVIGWFLISGLLSIIAGYMVSKWWFLVTACFGMTLLLIWIGEAVWESHAMGHW